MKNKKLNLKPLFFLLPALVLIIFVFLNPLIRIVYTSFFTAKGGEQILAGLLNYKNIFLVDTKFRVALRNNGFLLLGVPVLILLALATSSIIFEGVKGWRFFRTIFFLPYVLAITVVSVVFSFLYRSDGIINFILARIGLAFLQPDWLGNVNLAIFSVLLVIIWHEFGFGMILFLARLMSIDVQLYEAAIIDGANWWQRLRYVTVPQLRTIIEFYTVICIINLLSWSFNFIYSMTGGGPGNASYIMEFYIYKTAFSYSSPNYASALSVLLFIVVLVLIAIQQYLRLRAERLVR
jgi:ABC-type sugar transport system permease subunit